MAESVSRRASKGPKQRWTASQKKARTSAPRPASGFNRTSDRRDVGGRSDSRPVNGRTDRTFADRNDRGPSGDRQDRPRYADRSAPARTDDRGRYGDRSSAPRSDDRQDRPRYGDRPSTGRTDDRPRYEGRSDSRPDSRADAGRSRELPNSRWQAGRDSRRPNWSDEGARRDQVGSSGRWADARDSRGGQPRGREDDRPQTGTPPWRGSERNDRPAERSGDRYRSDDRSSTSNDRPRYGSDRPNSDRPRSTDDRPRYRSDDTRRDRPQRPDRPWEERRPGMDRPRSSAERGRPADRHRTEEPSSDQMEWTAPEVKAVASTSTGFADLGVPSELTAVLAGLGITDPFPIQTATIPDALEGRDVLGRGRTGSGKTLGFGLPMLTRLSTKRGMGVRGLVLVPTRELAMQVADVLAPLARATGLDVTLVAGGMPYGPQLRAFERGVDVVVATPGRLVDLLDQ